LKTIFLILGIVLSVCSKLLQFIFESNWGDLLVIPAAMFFVFSILLYNKTYCKWLEQKEKRKLAKIFAILCCLTVLTFQLFTMFTFGKGYSFGIIFAVPVVVFGAICVYYFRKLNTKSDL